MDEQDVAEALDLAAEQMEEDDCLHLAPEEWAMQIFPYGDR